MEEIEVTLHTDGSDIEVMSDSNTDTGLMNEEDETETQNFNPEGADSCSLYLNNNVDDCGSEKNEFCAARTTTSTSNSNDAEGCTDKLISEIAILRTPILKEDRDLENRFKTDSEVTGENYENSIIFTKKSTNSTCDSVCSSSLQSDMATSHATAHNLYQGKTNTEDCVVKDETSEKKKTSIVIVDKEGKSLGYEVDATMMVQDKCMNKFNEDEREKDCISTTSTSNKSCNENSKIFQFDFKQQTSEIKERVMSYWTKYACMDEGTCIDKNHSPTLLKNQMYEEEKSCVDNEKVSSSVGSGNATKELNCSDSYLGGTATVCESTVPNVRLPVHVQKNSSSLDVAASPNTSPEMDGNENCIQSSSPFITEPSFQICKLILDTPAHKELSPSCASTALGFTASSKSNQCSLEKRENSLTQHDNIDIDMECSQVDSTSRVKTDAFSFQASSGSMLNKEQVQKNMYFKDTNPILLQCELSRNSKSDFKNLLLANTSNAYSSKNTTLSSDPNIAFVNQNTQIPQGNCLNTAQDISTVSWGRLSFQPFTTPSINFPISSCKSSNDKNTSKHALNSVLPVSNSQIKNDNSSSSLLPQWSPKNCTEPRKANSSEAVCFSTSLSLPTGEDTCLNNANKTQVLDHSYIGKPVNISAELGTLDFRKSSGPFSTLTGINASGNICNTFDGSIEESSNVVGKTSVTDNVSSKHCFASGSCRSSSEKPFSAKSSVESIGLYNMSPMKQAAKEIVDLSIELVFTPPETFSLKREKNEVEGYTCDEKSSSCLKQDTSETKSRFSFPSDAQSLNRQTMCDAKDFSYSTVTSHEHLQSRRNFTFKSEQTLNECKDRQSSCLNAGTFTTQNKSSSFPFQFTFNAEKTMTHFTKRMQGSRRKPVKFTKHDRASPTNVKDASSVLNVIERGTGHVLFKPVYGSDVKVVHGINKNAIVRYQNIVLMDEFLDTSPEELRSQYYAKTCVHGPFKFTTTTDAHQIYNNKKTQNQETQTEKQLTPKKSELAGIWRALECPVCFDVVLPPVYQCDQGHHVCSTCWNKVVTCPLCKRFKSGTRNYMAEALIEQVPLPCKYHIEGCKETVQHVNKVNHEETCTYRMYECPVPLCNQAHSYQNMCKHFKKAHKTLLHHEGHSVGKGEKFCDVLYKEALSLFLIHAFDITKWGLFFLRKVTVQNSSALFVQIMPAVADQAVYFYHLEVSDHHDCRKECYKGRVFTMGKSTQDIVDQEEYLCLSDLILKTVNKNTPLKIVVTIWQLKPAFSLSTD